jgi:hypothetical protein
MEGMNAPSAQRGGEFLLFDTDALTRFFYHPKTHISLFFDKDQK